MIRRDFEIKNEMGLHARAAALFVQTTNKFASDIFVEKENERVNAKSIMGIMALGISKNSKITIIVNGIDEEEAKEIGKRKAKELKEEWDKENSEETKQQQKYEFISYYMGNYVEALKKQLWHDTRNESVSEEVIKLKKEFMQNISKILSQKLRVVWHQSYMDDSTSYSFEEVKEDEEVGDR